MTVKHMLDQPVVTTQRDEVREVPAIGPADATWLQSRTLLRVIFVILAVAALLWTLYTLKSVILLIVLATFFAYFVAPLVEVVRRPFIARRRERLMPRALAIGVVYVTLFGSIAVAAYVLLPRLGNQITEFGRQAPEYAAHARDRLQGWRHFVNPDDFPAAIRDAADKTTESTMTALQEYLTSGVGSLFHWVSYLPWLVLVPILAFFLLNDAESFRRSVIRSLPLGQLRGRGADFFAEVNSTLAAYIRAQLAACLLIGAVCTIGFVIAGVPYALMLGLMAGLLEFIPLVGPLVVALSATVICSFHSFGQTIGVLLFLAVLRMVQDYVVYPRLIRHGIHLHPLAVIVAVLCGAELGGVVGIFLAIPAAAVFSVAYRHWLDYRGSDGLVADLLDPAERSVVISSGIQTVEKR
jgi:predicted PurR-regulated permease PerM